MNDAWCIIYDEYLVVFVVFSAHVSMPILYTVWKVVAHAIIPALFLLVPVTAMLTLIPVYLLYFWLYTLFLLWVRTLYTDCDTTFVLCSENWPRLHARMHAQHCSKKPCGLKNHIAKTNYCTVAAKKTQLSIWQISPQQMIRSLWNLKLKLITK